ncbi:MAG: phosphate signaling complex protein PhoU [Caldilineaceae bacterium]
MREYYQQELSRLKDELYLLGSMVSNALVVSLDALINHDQEAAVRVIIGDRLINTKRYRMEEDCLILIATQAPMARDLRFLAGVLEIVSELERIGDYAKGIARITQYIGDTPHVKPLVHIPKMCDLVTNMLKRSLDAFIAGDVESARSIPKEDDEVDALYNIVNKDLIALIVQNPQIIDNANYLSWAAHNLERAADRVTNICERVIYTVTGELIEMSGPGPEMN